MKTLTIAKFGGSALGINGSSIPNIIERIKEMLKDEKVLTVFSAPLATYDDKTMSITDIGLQIGKNHAKSNPVDINILREVYQEIASKYMNEIYRKEFLPIFDDLYRQVIIALKHTTEYKRFVDVTRAKVLAYSGEIAISYAMDYVMKSNGINSSHVDLNFWPIITDDNFEDANFLLEESRKASNNLLELIENNDVVSIGGFIGKTTDGLETTYERGGSDRTAVDLAILLEGIYKVKIDFEKDNPVLSADPKIVNDDLEHITSLSYNEATLAGRLGMKILDPIAIKEIEENNLDVPLVITNMHNPVNITIIRKEAETSNANPLKIVTGKKKCAIVRMESVAASHMRVTLQREKMYGDFVQLSPYIKDHTEMSRMLFLDADYVKKNERNFKAYDSKVEILYGRGVVTLIGDEMWKVPKIASMASSTMSDNDINILNMDAQEETSRVLIVVDDKDENVENAIRTIHMKRKEINL